MTPALPHPINDRSPGLKKMVRKWMLSRDEAPCVQHMCTIGADCGMECACNACRDHVIQVGSLRESQTVCERRGVVRRGVPNRRLLSEVECPNAHPVGLETVDYLLNWSATHCAAGPRSLWASMPFAKVSWRSLSSCPYREPWWAVRICGLSFSRGMAFMKTIRGTI
jgi:hypothetical protein